MPYSTRFTFHSKSEVVLNPLRKMSVFVLTLLAFDAVYADGVGNVWTIKRLSSDGTSEPEVFHNKCEEWFELIVNGPSTGETLFLECHSNGSNTGRSNLKFKCRITNCILGSTSRASIIRQILSSGEVLKKSSYDPTPSGFTYCYEGCISRPYCHDRLMNQLEKGEEAAERLMQSSDQFSRRQFKWMKDWLADAYLNVKNHKGFVRERRGATEQAFAVPSHHTMEDVSKMIHSFSEPEPDANSSVVTNWADSKSREPTKRSLETKPTQTETKPTKRPERKKKCCFC